MEPVIVEQNAVDLDFAPFRDFAELILGFARRRLNVDQWTADSDAAGQRRAADAIARREDVTRPVNVLAGDLLPPLAARLVACEPNRELRLKSSQRADIRHGCGKRDWYAIGRTIVHA